SHNPLSARARDGSSRTPSSTRRAPTRHPETATPSSDRSAGLGVAHERLAELAAGHTDRDARYCRPLSARVRCLLALDVAAPPRRGPDKTSARRGRGTPRRALSSGTVMRFTDLILGGPCNRWASKKC